MTMFVLKKNNIYISYNTRVFHHNSKITLARHSAKLSKVLASFCIRKKRRKLTALFGNCTATCVKQKLFARSLAAKLYTATCARKLAATTISLRFLPSCSHTAKLLHKLCATRSIHLSSR